MVRPYDIMLQLRDSHITVDQALVLLDVDVDRKNAAMMIKQSLQGIVQDRNFPSESQSKVNWTAWIEFVYRVEGLGTVVRLFSDSSRTAQGTMHLAPLAFDLIETQPNELDDKDLEYVIDSFPLDHARRAREIQADRFRSQANQRAGVTQEISDDVRKVKQQLTTYGFPSSLAAVLDKVEEEFLKPLDEFDNKAAVGHLRSFYEKLHEHAAVTIQNRLPEAKDNSPLEKCGKAIEFLSKTNVDVLNDEWKGLAKALYGVLSSRETGAHGIASPQENLRLCRNMVIEYALMLSYLMDRRLAD